MKKIIYSLILVTVFSSFVTAQNIELPDVTTIIDGETIKVGLDALPDFSDVLIIDNGSGEVVPELPDVDAPADSDLEKSKNSTEEKSIFAEGLIGGGYPTMFLGDFSIFRTIGDSPFKLGFSYNSAVGYAGHLSTDGFNDRITKLTLEKSYHKNQFSWGFNGNYQSVSNGLQKHINGISSINQDAYAGNGNVAYEFDNGFSIGFDADVNFYNRYADVTEGSFPVISFLNLTPELLFKWHGNGFLVDFICNYNFGTDTSNTISDDNFHRGEFKLDFGWQNEFVNVYANAAAVVGNVINDNSVVVPFTVGIDAGIPVKFSDRKMIISAAGGIDSKLAQIYELENKYKFTALSFVPGEQSDWYGKIEMSVPVKDGFTGIVGFEYRQTAFDNIVYNPLFTNISSYGTFDYSGKTNQQFKSYLSLSYTYKFMTITGNWNSNWLDVPALENENFVSVDLNLQNDKSSFGVDVFAGFGLDKEKVVPVINFEGFVKVTSALRAVLSANDIIELFKNEQRIYAGDYITRGGNVCLLLKFSF